MVLHINSKCASGKWSSKESTKKESQEFYFISFITSKKSNKKMSLEEKEISNIIRISNRKVVKHKLMVDII